MNPLDIPWGKNPKVVKEKSRVPSVTGARSEALQDNGVPRPLITISVQGARGAPNGTYKLPWTEGTSLKQYLGKLSLLIVAVNSSIRDASNPNKGRVRLRYVPGKNAQIVLGNPSVSGALRYQRSNHDGRSAALRLGSGARIIDIPIRRC